MSIWLMKRLRRDDSGASLLELSLLTPLLITLGMGAAQFGDIIYRKHQIENGIRDAARYAARLPYDGINKATNETKAGNIAATGVVSGGTNKISWWNASSVTLTYSNNLNVANVSANCGGNNQPACFRGLGTNNRVYTVTASTTVTYPTNGILGFLNNKGLVPAIFTITASHQERVLNGEQP